MRFGHFDDNNHEYVITTPQTPYPWIKLPRVRAILFTDIAAKVAVIAFTVTRA